MHSIKVKKKDDEIKEAIFTNETIFQYEELRSKTIEQSITTERGWAAFIRHGMLGWSSILVDNDKRESMNQGCNLSNNIFLESKNPVISILANMVHCIQGEAV